MYYNCFIQEKYLYSNLLCKFLLLPEKGNKLWGFTLQLYKYYIYIYNIYTYINTHICIYNIYIQYFCSKYANLTYQLSFYI